MLTADDYRWFQRDDNELALDFCLTFIKGLTPGEVTRRLKRARLGRLIEVPGGTLMVEPNGSLGIRDEINRPLSAGTDVVVVYDSEHSDSEFHWVHDGDARLVCDPYLVNWREGSDPDALLEPMRRLGFNFSTAEAGDPEWVYDEDAPLRAFALAEHLTGIRLPEELLPPPESAAAEDDCWSGIDLPDQRLRAAGPSGAQLAYADMPLLLALFRAGDQVCREVTRWAREWAFNEAELTGRPHADEVLAVLRSGGAVSDMLRFQLSRHVDPPPMAPSRQAGGGYDRGSRQMLAMEMLHNPVAADPLAAACDALIAAATVDAGRNRRVHADLRRAFPTLDAPA